MNFRIKKIDKIPTRLVIALMMFFACFVNYMLRVNMSVNIIAMVPDKEPAGKIERNPIATNATTLRNGTLVLKTPRSGRAGSPTFDWTVQEQAYILSAYFWGYAATCLIGGTAAEYWGTRKLIFTTTMISSILNILCPPMAKFGYKSLVALRVLNGLAAGFMYPALHSLLAHWAPPNEKGKFVSSLLGGAIGTVFTWSLTGPLIEHFGWESAFYVPGVFVCLWCFLWWYLVHDSPLHHPRISATEKTYILDAIGNKVQEGTRMPPFKRIFTSFPYLAMVILHYGSNWGLYFMMTAAPKFVSSVLGFNLTSTGTLSSLPYLARMIFSLIFGTVGDKIVKKNVVPITIVRKCFCVFSHIIPGLLLIVLGYSGCSPGVSVFLITLSMGSNGAAIMTNLVIHQDLAPNFAGTLYGIANGIGNTSGFVTPLVTAHFTKHGNTFKEWGPVFLVGALLYIGAACYFIIFGTAKTQPWNYAGGEEPPAANKASEPSTNANVKNAPKT